MFSKLSDTFDRVNGDLNAATITKMNAIAASAAATPKPHRKTRARGPVPIKFSMYLECKMAPVPQFSSAYLGGT